MRALGVILGWSTALSPVVSAQEAPAPAHREAGTGSKARAAELVARMTLEEKAAQIHHNAPGIPRLGVPAYNWWNEGLHGVARAGEATVFPQAIALAATWDVALMQNVADTIATEHRAKYVAGRKPDGSSTGYRGLTIWSPNVNIFRDPRWGRGQETYGEDPYLTSRMAVAFIRGLQGDDPGQPKTVAAVKHLAVHSGPEPSRHTDDIHPSPRDVTETYLPAFHASITEARAQAIMCAYNAIDGVPACANTVYLKDILRRDWKFDGHVVSDCAAVADFYLPTSHAWVKTPEEAVAAAVRNGTDLICDFVANKTTDPQTTVSAVRQGLLPVAELDAALVRLFEARFALGTMELTASGRWAGIGAKDFDTPAHRALALETARKSLVLLKNDGLLPLKAAPKRIAVIGPNADSVDALVGNYNGTPSKPRTIVAGLKTRFPEAQVDYVEGTGWVAPPLEDVPDAALCADAACTQPGLKMEDFANPRLEGAPGETRTDKNAVYRWGWPTRLQRDGTVRWSGYIKPDESGRYRFRYTGDAGYRIWVDDKLIADVWDIAWPTSDTEVELTAGKPVKLRIEAAQKGQRGEQRFRWSRPSAAGDKAMAAAKDADLIVFAGGLTARLEGEEMRVAAPGFDGGDRTSLDLPAPQQKLLEALHATGKPVVLVLMNGSAMSVNWADKNLPAIVEAWYPGGEGGDAVAQLIAGDFSPSGRLPLTFYQSADQLPPFTDYGMDGRTYRYSRATPLYPFGHGLSYTRFSYGKPVLSAGGVKAGQPVTLKVEVRNSGARAGDEVVQLYAARAVPGAPVRSLWGFQRVSLKPGEAKTLSFTVDAKAMSVVGTDGNRVVEPGKVDLWVGGGQPLARPGLAQASGAAASLTVTGRKAIPKF
ncbi:MAG TPA: glycoside hydrolase family 3 C-terminal domain-containing protein [Sphingomonas sp.]|nr:glycoside hydrolase family 3 C-terminal domain-containing protein [Sphingomonas sp.]